jgi:hypothetical protein
MLTSSKKYIVLTNFKKKGSALIKKSNPYIFNLHALRDSERVSR